MPLNKIYRWVLYALSLAVSIAAAVLLYGFVRDILLRQSGLLYVAEPAIVKVPAPIEGNVASVDVKLRSISDKPVRIVGASTSCSCLVPGSQFPIELGPGESHSVRFRINVDERTRQKGGTIGQAIFLVEAASPPVMVQFVEDAIPRQAAASATTVVKGDHF